MKSSTDIIDSKIKLKNLLIKSTKQKNINALISNCKTFKNLLQNSFNQSTFTAEESINTTNSKLYKKSKIGSNSALQLHRQSSKLKQNFISGNSKQKILNLPKSYAGFIKSKRHNETADWNKQRHYASRLTAKEYYQNVQFMNETSPLQIWKQLSRSYIKTHKQNQPNFQQFNQRKTHKQLSDKNLQLIISNQKQNITQNFENSQSNHQLQQLIRKWKLKEDDKKSSIKSKKNQTQLEKNIVLKKSLSCKISTQRNENQKQNVHKIDSFITQQQPAQFQGLKKKKSNQFSKNNPNSIENNEQNSVVLLHKQPLQEYLELFFKPITPIQTSQDKQKPQEFIRIKTKKLTIKKIECLQKLKKNLFKQKSSRNLFAQTLDSSQQSSQKQNLLTEGDRKKSKNLSKRSNRQSLQKIFKSECRKVMELQNCHTLKIQTKSTEHDFSTSDKNPDSTHTPSLQKVSPSSSVISFSEEPTPQKQRINIKDQSFFNAW